MVNPETRPSAIASPLPFSQIIFISCTGVPVDPTTCIELISRGENFPLCAYDPQLGYRMLSGSFSHDSSA